VGHVVLEQFYGVAEADPISLHHPIDDGSTHLTGSHAMPQVGLGADDQAGGPIFVKGAAHHQVFAVLFEGVPLGLHQADQGYLTFDALDEFVRVSGHGSSSVSKSCQVEFENYFSVLYAISVKYVRKEGGTIVATLIRSVAIMSFAKKLVDLRKKKGLTQQALADAIGLHVTQIKRYESGDSQPSLEAIKKIAQTLCVTTDSLIFEEDELAPDADLALQFRAVSQMPPEERRVIQQLLEGMIIKYEAERWSSKAKR